MRETTRDALWNGALTLEQPRDGYRFNIDSLLLATFATAGRAGPARRACDLGAGVGAVGLSLLHLGGALHVTLVERDAIAAALAESNAGANDFAARTHVVRADVSAYAKSAPASADLVVMNPPYFRPGAARVPKNASAAGARVGPLETFARAARAIVRTRARVCFVYPAPDFSTAAALFRACGLEAKRVRFVHARATVPARIALVEAQPGKPGGLVVEPPIFEK